MSETASAPQATAILIRASASSRLASDQSLKRLTSASARMRRPFSRASSPAFSGAMPSNSGWGRSLRTSTPMQPRLAAVSRSSTKD
jgi:hypothetical protein